MHQSSHQNNDTDHNMSILLYHYYSLLLHFLSSVGSLPQIFLITFSQTEKRQSYSTTVSIHYFSIS